VARTREHSIKALYEEVQEEEELLLLLTRRVICVHAILLYFRAKHELTRFPTLLNISSQK